MQGNSSSSAHMLLLAPDLSYKRKLDGTSLHQGRDLLLMSCCWASGLSMQLYVDRRGKGIRHRGTVATAAWWQNMADRHDSTFIHCKQRQRQGDCSCRA